jgi:hypothetical protein
MKIGLSFIALTSAAVLALGASAAQARIGVSQEATARTEAAKRVALWYQAEDSLFNKFKRDQTVPLTVARGITGEPPWPGNEWTARFCTPARSIGGERCVI